MSINKVSTLNAGIYINPNTFSRSLTKAYEDIGAQINTLADVFTLGERAPVNASDLLTRWEWTTNTNISGHTSITDVSNGLDGTAIYAYGAMDYVNIDPIFVVYNPDPENNNENRPATIYESFIKLKSYTDTAIAQRTSALVNLVSTLDIDLTGVEDGTIIYSVGEEIAASGWQFITGYSTGADYGLVAPGGNKILANDGYITIEAPVLNVEAEYVRIGTVTTAPTGVDANAGRVYYSGYDKNLHLVNEDGDDFPLGASFYEEDIVNLTFSLTADAGTNLFACATADDGPWTLTLPALSGVPSGRQIIVIDRQGAASFNNIEIYPDGSDQFVGYASGPVVIDTNNGALGLMSTSFGWVVLYGR
jgi:hypothetical protein